MSAGSARTFNLAQCQFIVNGLPIEGFGESDAAVWAPDEDLYTKVVGADGEVSRARTNNYSGSLTITLMSTSKSNDVMNALMILTKLISAGDMAAILIQDLGSPDRFFGQKCWLKREPDMSFGRDVTERTWTFDVARGDTTHGGSFA